VAAAAVLVLAAGAGWLALALRSSAWTVNSVAGAPAIGDRAVVTQGGSNRGEWLVTDNQVSGRGSPSAASATWMSSRTRGSSSSRRDGSTAWRSTAGTIHARIWAPPKLFFVNTQAALAVDLGCAYTLQIDAQGAGLLRVTSGWVGLEREGRDAFVPEGPCARCATMPGRNAALRRRAVGLRRSADRPRLQPLDDPRRAAALELVISTARRRDAMTLWHLLTRGTPDERRASTTGWPRWCRRPQDVTRELILAGTARR
jgi:hypothetical protein